MAYIYFKCDKCNSTFRVILRLYRMASLVCECGGMYVEIDEDTYNNSWKNGFHRKSSYDENLSRWIEIDYR